jgi:hypothetical protein
MDCYVYQRAEEDVMFQEGSLDQIERVNLGHAGG